MSASRQRVRRVYAATQDLLEQLHPGKGTEMTNRLRRRFVAPASIFESGVYSLEEMDVSPADALLLSLIPGIARYTLKESFGDRPRLDSCARAGAYLCAQFLGLTFEHFYLLALNPAGRLISSVLLQRGTVDQAPFYVRNVLNEVVRTRASAVIIGHNHPNNTLSPSHSDIACTQLLIAALEPLGVPLLDHIIVANQQAVSLRATGLIREAIFLAQAPDDTLLQGYLRKEDS